MIQLAEYTIHCEGQQDQRQQNHQPGHEKATVMAEIVQARQQRRIWLLTSMNRALYVGWACLADRVTRSIVGRYRRLVYRRRTPLCPYGLLADLRLRGAWQRARSRIIVVYLIVVFLFNVALLSLTYRSCLRCRLPALASPF